MVSTKIQLSRYGLLPPIFIAGSFNGWQPTIELEMERVAYEGETRDVFYTVVDLLPGVYEYKFRLGHGDWWITDDVTEKGMSTRNELRRRLLLTSLSHRRPRQCQ